MDPLPTIGEAIRRLERLDGSIQRVHVRLDELGRDIAGFAATWEAMEKRVEALEANWTWMWRMLVGAIALGAIGLMFGAVIQ